MYDSGVTMQVQGSGKFAVLRVSVLPRYLYICRRLFIVPWARSLLLWYMCSVYNLELHLVFI